MTIYLLQDYEDDYEVCAGDIGLYSTREKAIEAAQIDASNRNRAIEFRPRKDGNFDDIVIRAKVYDWSDDVNDMTWDGETWRDWGWYFISEYQLDTMPQKAIEE
jgi:hypothetical protein